MWIFILIFYGDRLCTIMYTFFLWMPADFSALTELFLRYIFSSAVFTAVYLFSLSERI